MLFLSELQNIRPTLKNNYSFGNGLELAKMNKLMARISNESIGYNLRFFNDRWSLFYKEPSSTSLYIDGDPSGAIRFMVDALLLSVGPEVRLGPKIAFEYKTKAKYRVHSYCYTGIHLNKPWPHQQVKLTLYKIKEIEKMFDNLVKVAKNNFIDIPLSFYRRACELESLPHEALVYGVIGLESIFLNREQDKATTLAERSATFLNNKSKMNSSIIYRRVFSIYKIRNSIIHDGTKYPRIKISDNSKSWKLDCIKAKDSCLDYLRKILMYIIKNPDQDKNSFITQLKSSKNTIPFPKYKYIHF